MAFRVIAPLIHLAGTEVPHAYRGRILKHIPDPVQRRHLLDQGMVEEVPDPLPPGVAEDAPAPEIVSEAPVQAPAAPGADVGERPAATASKETWVNFVVATGAAKSAEEANALTKDDLIKMAG